MKKLNCRIIICPGKVTVTPAMKPLVKRTIFGANTVLRLSAEDGGHCPVCGARKGWLRVDWSPTK